MIDLTPLDVRKKRGDFRTVFRGYDPEEVDTFLEVVAERLEAVVSENRTLTERTDRLQERVAAQEGREEAVKEALVTAQELREEVRQQARREADLLLREAEAEAERVLAEAERRLAERREALEEMERMRNRFLKSFRTLLERHLDGVEVEEGRSPLDDGALEISFSAAEVRDAMPEAPAEPSPDPVPDPGPEPVDIDELAPDPAAGEHPGPGGESDRGAEPLWLLDDEEGADR